jgi:hypothetical protein
VRLQRQYNWIDEQADVNGIIIAGNGRCRMSSNLDRYWWSDNNKCFVEKISNEWFSNCESHINKLETVQCFHATSTIPAKSSYQPRLNAAAKQRNGVNFAVGKNEGKGECKDGGVDDVNGMK